MRTTKRLPLEGKLSSKARLMRCSRLRHYFYFDGFLQNPTPHPSFATQNPPSPQGEGYGSANHKKASLRRSVTFDSHTHFFVYSFFGLLLLFNRKHLFAIGRQSLHRKRSPSLYTREAMVVHTFREGVEALPYNTRHLEK